MYEIEEGAKVKLNDEKFGEQLQWHIYQLQAACLRQKLPRIPDTPRLAVIDRMAILGHVQELLFVSGVPSRAIVEGDNDTLGLSFCFGLVFDEEKKVWKQAGPILQYTDTDGFTQIPRSEIHAVLFGD